MLSLLPSRHLAQRLARADETAEHAAEQLYRARMLEITRLVRSALPSATTLVVEARNKDVESEGVQLHEILAGQEVMLWSATQPSPASLVADRLSGEHTWADVTSHVGYALTSALGAMLPQDRWQQRDPAHAGNGIYTVELHTDDEVAATTAVPAGKLGAKLCDDQHSLWLAEPSAAPTMVVGGVRITANIAADGRLLIDVTSDLPDAPGDRTGSGVELNVLVDGYIVFPVLTPDGTAARGSR